MINVSRERLEKLASQMKYRLAEGGGEAFYVIGITDEGEPLGLPQDEAEYSLKALEKVAEVIGAKLQILRRRKGKKGIIYEVLVRLSREDSPPVYVNVASLGNVDAGKSTLVGVLCTGQLDDGEGLTMRSIARYLHEIESGRTSSVSTHLLGYDSKGNVVNYDIVNPLDESQVYLSSSKVIIFVDLGGHERYLRTTLRGVMSRIPDYVMLVIGANSGLSVMGREHLGIAIALKIPVFAVITKIDMVHEDIVERSLEELKKILKMPGISKLPFEVKDYDDVVVAAKHVVSGRIVPIFKVSNVTGEGLELLRKFLNILPPRMRWKERVNSSLLMYVDDIFNVKGVGPVVAGLLLSGSVHVDDKVLIGPLRDGSWRKVRVKSIHINRVFVKRAQAGIEATLALSGIEFEDLEKGMAVIDDGRKPLSVREFNAKVTILKHPTTIRKGYEAVLHLGAIRSTVKFVKLEKECMRTGDTGIVTLKFVHHPWYIRSQDVFVIRDARTRAIGKVLKIVSVG